MQLADHVLGSESTVSDLGSVDNLKIRTFGPLGWLRTPLAKTRRFKDVVREPVAAGPLSAVAPVLAIDGHLHVIAPGGSRFRKKMGEPPSRAT